MNENILTMLSETRKAGVVHPGTRLTTYIYDELSFLFYPTPCGSVVDVNSLNYSVSKTRDWYRLLPVFIGIILLVQSGSAIDCTLDLSTPPNNVFLGSTVTITAHLYDPGYPGVRIPNNRVLGTVYSDSGEHADLTTFTNASGWSVISYKPPTPGRYVFTFGALVNYSTVPGLPAVGLYTSHAVPAIVVNVTAKHIPLTPLITLAPLATTTTTPVPLVTTTQTTQQTTPVTQATLVTQATPAPQTSSAVPASQSDTTPPVTTLTLAGTEDGSGGYSSDVICTLAATDNAGGSSVSVTQYSFNGTSWYTYSQPVSVVKAGTTTFYYRSADKAGNMEVAQLKAVVISSPGAALTGTTVPGAGSGETTPTVTSAPASTGSPPPFWLIVLIILMIIAAIGGYLYSRSIQKEEPGK